MVIKNEPIILVPYLSFNLMLTIIGQSFELFEKNLLLNGVIQWVVPTLILQPIIIVMALHVIRKDDLQVQQLLLKSRACSWPFLLHRYINLCSWYPLFNWFKWCRKKRQGRVHCQIVFRCGYV